MRIDRLVVVGTGLIGGSCALALRAASAVGEVVAVGRSQANLDTARARGIADRTYTLDQRWIDEVARADVVLLAAPVAQFPPLFAALAPALGPNTILTDAGSTKQDVVAAARSALGRRIAAFVPGHPIAGSEQVGAGAAAASLFAGRSVVLTPLAETPPSAILRIRQLWMACGARVSTLTPERHDAVFAAVSHLPHVLAFALVAELATRPDGEALLAQAGGGFRDFTRIAASSPEMWRDIALANRAALLQEIAAYCKELGALARLIADGDGDALAARFAQAAEARRRWESRLPASGDEG